MNLGGGRDISCLGESQAAEFRRNELGFVFQDFNLVYTLTVRETIMLPLMMRRVPPARMKAEATAYLRDCFADQAKR